MQNASYSQCVCDWRRRHNLQSALQMSPDLTTSSHTQSAEIGFQTGKLKQGFVCRYLQVAMLVVCNCRASPQMVGCWLSGSGLISPHYLQYLLSTIYNIYTACSHARYLLEKIGLAPACSLLRCDHKQSCTAQFSDVNYNFSSLLNSTWSSPIIAWLSRCIADNFSPINFQFYMIV